MRAVLVKACIQAEEMGAPRRHPGGSAGDLGSQASWRRPSAGSASVGLANRLGTSPRRRDAFSDLM